MSFVPVFGSSVKPEFAGSTLVIPCHSAGMSPFIGLDLYILNEGMQKVGYYKSDFIAPGVSNDGLSVVADQGVLTLPAELYVSGPGQANKLTFLVLRSGILSGQMRKFGDELVSWINSNGFSNVIVLTSTISPVQRERNTNRL
jgi:predicted ATP-grasp superfamily ATP-dependent carboligase